MWLRSLIFIFLATYILASCSGRKDPDSVGTESEIVIVCSKYLWKGPVGDTIRSALMRNMEGLPDAEPEFTLKNIPEEDFTTAFQLRRNVFVINIDETYKKSRVETLKNVWSDPQRVIKIKASSDTAFINLFAKHREAIMELFNQSERARYNKQNAESTNLEVEKLLKDQLGIKMFVAKDFHLERESAEFICLRSGSDSGNIGLIIYTFPFKDTAQINPSAVLASINNVTKQNMISSNKVGSNITIESELFAPQVRKILFKEMFAIDMRGLWKTETDTGSGPFISYTIIDAPRKRIVVFCGFVNCPYEPKRNYIRKLESVIWGSEFCEPEKRKIE